jgi:predicted AlkP superfamily pyrophosphatase or phosphodiesterase
MGDMKAPSPLVVVNAVGLTRRLLHHGPNLVALASRGWQRSLRPPLPAVTCTAQATLLTGTSPPVHGIVANGWFFRDTGEVRFWLQSNRLLQADPLYVFARRIASAQGRRFRCAKLFWWFNQGADVDISVTPKPYYGADGNKVFAIHGKPEGLTTRLQNRLGPFPFHTFWGPKAGRGCTTWIARCAAEILEAEKPDLTLVYLPHLDYDPQRYGPSRCNMRKLVRELDDDIAIILDAAAVVGARVWVVSEYGHVDVKTPILPNRALREAGLLAVRDGPFGETLETFESRAFAVCDHQLAHVYVRDPEDIPRVKDLVAELKGVAGVFTGEERRDLALNHPRSGDLIALSRPDAWFAYPYWLDDRKAPDFARTVDIHRKPGFDPCEMFYDPRLWWPTGRVLWRLLQKKLGFRTLFDVVPLDPSLVGGSHGLIPSEPDDMPLLIGDGEPPREGVLPMTEVRDLILRAVLGP